MKNIFFLFFLVSLSISAQSFKIKQNKMKNSSKYTTDTSWKKLSLREKIGQTMMVTSDYNLHLKIGNGDLQSFLNKYPVGGLFVAQWRFNRKNFGDAKIEDFIPKIMQVYENASSLPLFFSEDFERGVGYNYSNATKLPVEMTLGAANDDSLAYAYGTIAAQESRAMGFNWLLNPVADLNMNPLHPLVIERAISDNAELAIPLLQNQIRGIHDQNVISTIKHFPGDGATICDQHVITSSNNLSFKEWKKTYGRVFQTFINDNAPSIMVGHIRLPAYQKETIDGVFPPATLSREIMQKLLKKQMKFKGVVISDAMNMGGATGFYDTELEAAIQCFVAGADIILWPNIKYLDTVEARIIRGEIPMSRLDDAVQRIWTLRKRFNLLEKKQSIAMPLQNDHSTYVLKTLTNLSQKAVTLIQDKKNELPLKPSTNKKILLANISYSDKSKLFEPMKRELEARGFDVTLTYDLHFYKWQTRLDSLNKFDKIIVCFENKYFDPIGSPLLKDHEAFSLWTINSLQIGKIIGVSFGNPYYNTFYLNKAQILINAYSSDEYMQIAVVKALTGEIKCTAKSPVNVYNDIMK